MFCGASSLAPENQGPLARHPQTGSHFMETSRRGSEVQLFVLLGDFVSIGLQGVDEDSAAENHVIHCGFS